MSQVEYINHMGDDNMVVDAARVSFNKTSDNYSTTSNTRLIKYLRSHKHWSPFSHCVIQFRITAPIYVARQLFKHQIGFSLNEISRRYVDFTPMFDPPTTWRARPGKNKKQGSGGNLENHYQLYINSLIREHIESSKTLYRRLLELNVAPEQARVILPLYTETQWIWTGTLEGWLRVCGLRLAEDAQAETRDVATQIAKYLQKLYPICWEASQTATT